MKLTAQKKVKIMKKIWSTMPPLVFDVSLLQEKLKNNMTRLCEEVFCERPWALKTHTVCMLSDIQPFEESRTTHAFIIGDVNPDIVLSSYKERAEALIAVRNSLWDIIRSCNTIEDFLEKLPDFHMYVSRNENTAKSGKLCADMRNLGWQESESACVIDSGVET